MADDTATDTPDAPDTPTIAPTGSQMQQQVAERQPEAIRPEPNRGGTVTHRIRESEGGAYGEPRQVSDDLRPGAGHPGTVTARLRDAGEAPAERLDAATLRDMTVEEVRDYIQSRPDQRDRIIEMERAGAKRKGVVDDL